MKLEFLEHFWNPMSKMQKSQLSQGFMAIALGLIFSAASVQAQNSVTSSVPTIDVAPETTSETSIPSNLGVKGQEGLNATVWVQTSAEARFASQQAYRLATFQLDKALKDKSWSAAIEQTPPFKKKKPAIILDIDETVLDNSAYQARLVRDDAMYSGATWDRWVAQSDAPPIPGSLQFLNYAASKGVQIFYVSNRGIAEEAATRENLKRVGLPLQEPEDHVLMNGEMPEWTSDKTTRRRFVAEKYRVLLLFGDDFNDFIAAKPFSVQERYDLLAKYEAFLGERWIILPNPLYGSWESAIFDFKNGLSREEMLRLKYGSLRTQEPVRALAPTVGNGNATR